MSDLVERLRLAEERAEFHRLDYVRACEERDAAKDRATAAEARLAKCCEWLTEIARIADDRGQAGVLSMAREALAQLDDTPGDK